MAMQKEAIMMGIAKGVGRLAFGAGKAAVTNPMKTMALASGGAAAVGKAKQYRAGFDPNVQRAQEGPPPRPPGVIDD
jgi:hypothetical protein